MKKREYKWMIVVAAVVLLILIIVIGIKILKRPYQQKLDSIVLPPGAKTITTKISLSDVYGIHVCAEKVICCELRTDEVERYLRENNTSEVTDYLGILRINKETKIISWDDYNIDVEKLDYSEPGNYYLISVNTPYCELSY